MIEVCPAADLLVRLYRHCFGWLLSHRTGLAFRGVVLPGFPAAKLSRRGREYLSPLVHIDGDEPRVSLLNVRADLTQPKCRIMLNGTYRRASFYAAHRPQIRESLGLPAGAGASTETSGTLVIVETDASATVAQRRATGQKGTLVGKPDVVALRAMPLAFDAVTIVVPGYGAADAAAYQKRDWPFHILPPADVLRVAAAWTGNLVVNATALGCLAGLLSVHARVLMQTTRSDHRR